MYHEELLADIEIEFWKYYRAHPENIAPLAKRMGISHTALRQFIKGQRNQHTKTLVKMSNYLKQGHGVHAIPTGNIEEEPKAGKLLHAALSEKSLIESIRASIDKTRGGPGPYARQSTMTHDDVVAFLFEGKIPDEI